MPRTVKTALGAALLAFLVAAAAAQPAPGDAVALTSNGVLNVTPGGVVSTLSRLPGGHVGLGLCMAFGNRGVAVLTRHATPNQSTLFLMELTGQTWKTLGSVTSTGPLTIGGQGGVERDQRGDYIVASPQGFLRVPGTGGQVGVVRRTGYTGVSDHLRSGGWLTLSGGQVSHVTRQGTATRLGSLPGPTIFGAGGILADTVTGDAYVALARLYRFDLTTQSFTTMRVSGIGNVTSGDIDPASRTLVVGSSTGVYRVSRAGALLGTFAQLNTGVVGVTVFGSSQVAVFGPCNPGTTSVAYASFPTEPNQFYQLGASFGFRPGFATNVGVVPLNPDPLFALVFAASGIFTGFGGPLDGNGVGAGQIVLPKLPALRGLRFFVAGISYTATGRIAGISEPVGVTVE
jgi:hypothetical protein